MKHQNITYLQQDVTGLQDFLYDSLGNIKQNRHTYVVPNSSNAFTFITRWNYDSWNRVMDITYPDNDIVTYTYNKGGLLKGIKGNKYGVQTNYIRNINYDTYEQRSEEYFGNGTKTFYSYESLMRRLDKIVTIDSIGLYLLNNKYTYYPEGNIKQIQNTGTDPYTHTYDYDHDYQLLHAAGSGTWDLQTIPYNLSMTYSPSGKILSKQILNSKRLDNNGTTTINYRNNYNYNNSNNPYGVSVVHDNVLNYDYRIRWDVKGNMVSQESPQWGGNRQLCWTEDNRLENVKDNKMGAYYNYDAPGERNLKLNGGTTNVTQNGSTVIVPVLDQQTLYASSLVTVNDQGYTKHYFEEGKRICSKIGNGRLTNVTAPVTPIAGDYASMLKKIPDNIIESFSICIGAKPYVKTKDLYTNIIQPNINQTSSTEPGFYYHSDHLGSSSYITGDNGQKTQALANLPFGEDWVDLKYNSPTYTTPYKFNGKEKDEETSYNYYGARYYWSEGGIFISTDPLSDKYPSTSSYAYCRNNPVMLIDPNGMEDYKVDSKGNINKIEGQGKKGVDRLIRTNFWNKVKYNQDGSPRGKYIEVEEGTFKEENTQKGKNGEYALYLNTNRTQAEKISGFLSDNTDVEYSLIESTDNTNIITTSHKRGGDDYGSSISKVIASKGELKSHVHNHFRNSDPSKDDLNGSDGSMGGDLWFKNDINTRLSDRKQPNATFGIYYKGKIYKY